jgi:hypothetical protein
LQLQSLIAFKNVWLSSKSGTERIDNLGCGTRRQKYTNIFIKLRKIALGTSGCIAGLINQALKFSTRRSS